MHREVGKSIKPLIHSLKSVIPTVFGIYSIPTFMLILKEKKDAHMLPLTVQIIVTAATTK